jgi:hypothetical protein
VQLTKRKMSIKIGLELSFEKPYGIENTAAAADINLRPGGASETDIPRPPEGYRDVLSWGIIYKINEDLRKHFKQ